jgi:hypothetical protein
MLSSWMGSTETKLLSIPLGLQKNTHIVAQYFDLKTQSYLKNVMSPAFGVSTYWHRQEFA